MLYIRYQPIALGGGGGGGGVTTIGTIDSQTPSANGAVIVGSQLFMQAASLTVPGLVNALAQSFTGQKTFATGLTGTLTGSASLNILTSARGNFTAAGADGIAVIGGTNATIGAVSIAQQVADATHNGYLNSTDWNTFNNKQAALTLTNLTDAGTDGITITNGTGAVIGASPVTLSQHVADSTHNGYLSSTDWSTFNGKQAAGNYITALTGDATASGPGSAALTLATVNGNVGSFAIATITANAKGLITAASAAATTGSGSVVLATTPTLVTPVIGAATGTSLNVSGTVTGSQHVSTVSTGTAPLVVSSTTQVANLNAATAGAATTATDATNAANVATTATTTNASFFPLFVASATNSNQACSLKSTGFTFNPSTNVLTVGTVVGALTGTASGNTTYTANNHGVVLSGSGNTMTVIAPVASTSKVLTSGGTGADPTWADVSTFSNSQVISTSTTGFGSTNTKIRTFGTPSVTGTDITYATSATNGDTFTVNTAGVYAISYSEEGSTGTPAFGLSVNSVNLTTDIQSIPTNERRTICAVGSGNDRKSTSWCGILAANDIIRAHTNNTAVTAVFVNSGVVGITMVRVQ